MICHLICVRFPQSSREASNSRAKHGALKIDSSDTSGYPSLTEPHRPRMSQNVICIAGAHRSGTSMLTRLLHHCGLYLGPEEDLMAPAADNPDGFWENLRFVKLNDEILNALGGGWDLPPREEDGFQEEQLAAIRMKAQLLIESFDSELPWGWKDPRTCLTMPFWQSLLPALRTVMIVRNPLEVAYSMHKRNGTSYAFGLRLWEIYNRELIRRTPPDARIVTHYQFFFERPETELRRIAAFAGLPDAEIEEVARLVAQGRRHTSFTTEQLIDAGASEQIVAFYRSLIDEAAEGATSLSKRGRRLKGRKQHKKIPAARPPRVDELAGAVSRLNVSIPDGEAFRTELALRRGAEIQYRADVANLESKIQTLTQELASASQRTAGEIGTRDGRIAEMEATVVRLDHMLQREQAKRQAELLKAGETTEQLRIAREKLAEQARMATEQQRIAKEQLTEQKRLANEQRSCDLAELKKIRERFIQTNQLLHSKSVSQTEFEARNTTLTEQLRKQLQATKKLVRLLDEAEHAAERLRQSRRWKIANLFAWLVSVFSKHPAPGFGHLDKVVETYHRWRSTHPQGEALEEALQALTPHAPTPAPVLAQPHPPAEPAPERRVEPPAPLKPIEFPLYEEVEISIIIPVFNQYHFTQACLASLQENHDGMRFEVIVVDDCSTDATMEMIERIPGVVYLPNESNMGFIASCNRGAQQARGSYLLFLNNDTVVTPGWLARLRETFEFEPQAGLVGSKLVFPDGRLQEAGGIIWRDASGWNRGKFQDAEKPEYNFLCEVDYCSAASLMIPKSLFDGLGCFDPKYAPGYYEDTDLAFKVRQAGYKVLYQPLSKVIHYEGATGGTDISAGAKKYQEINRATFAASWADLLAEKPANGDLRAYEALKPGSKRILVIDHHLPMPDRDSGSLRMSQILNILHGLGHRVTFLPDNLADIPPYGDDLRKRGIEVVHHPHIKSARAYLEAHGPEFDVVILSRCDFARKHVANVRQYAPQSRVIFDTVDLHFLREEREAELTQDPELQRKAADTRHLEYELIDQADETWVVSSVEEELLHAERPDKSIEVVSNIVSVPGSATPFSLRSDILFIGSFQHTPNIDAALFFIQEIFPHVRSQLPTIRFYIIGDKAPPEVIALADEDIVVTGYQPDVSSYFDRIKLSIAPLRFGAGVKGKINQSMGFGVPVVATSLAVEGMDLTPREDVLVADEPETFANAVIELYRSEELWRRLSKNSARKMKKRYSVEAARKRLQRLLSTAQSPSDGGHVGSAAVDSVHAKLDPVGAQS
jgi:GT2 family glycosyltransferase